MEKIVESFELYGKQYRLETGELAKQATGAVLVTQGETTVLVTAVVSKQERDYDFFPLTVDFIEKMYSVGRIPRRLPEARGAPLRQGHAHGAHDRPPHTRSRVRRLQAGSARGGHHVRVRRREPARHHLRGRASAAPARGRRALRRPRGLRAHRARRGNRRVRGEPHVEESERSDLELTMPGTADYISMVEAGADEISEEDMLAAMAFGQEAIARVLREAGGVLGQGEPPAAGVQAARARPGHRRARGAHTWTACRPPCATPTSSRAWPRWRN